MVSSPKPPDPVQTAQAQAGMNRDTAISQQQLNMVNQVNPWGTVGYEQTGTGGFTDSQGNWIETPQYTQTTTFSPEQQAIFDRTQAAQGNLASIADQQSQFLQGYLGQGIDTGGLPGLVGDPGLQGQIGGGFDTNFQRGFGPDFNAQFSGDLGPDFNAQFASGFGPDYSAQFATSFGPDFSTQFASDLGPGWSSGVNLADSYAGADDFSADRQRVEEALWQRTAGDRASQEEALRTRLLNSGIREGSAAWNAEMERMARQNTDARLATILAGGNEQARMVGMARDAAGFGNDARLAQAGFGNQAALAAGQFGSQQQQLQNAASAAQAQFGSQQQQVQNAAAAAQAQFGSQQQQLQNAAALEQGQFGSQQQQLQNAAAAAQSAFGSQQQQAQNAAALAQGQFGNQAALQGAAFQNAARGQGMAELFGLRNQPINEITALMSGSQVSNPAQMGAPTPQAGVGGVDYTGLVNQQYQHNLANHQNMMGGLFGLGAAGIGLFSDRRLKTDIRRVGQTDGGTPLYAYRYIWGGPVHIGVMADEVPNAAMMTDSGYLAVDYAKVA